MSAAVDTPAAAAAGDAADMREAEKNVALLHEVLRETVDEILADLAAAKGGSLKAIMAAVGVADMKQANLASMDLRSEDLSGISFAGADLSGADLRDCDLRGCDFSYAILDGAKWEGARGSDALDYKRMALAESYRLLAERLEQLSVAASPAPAGARPASGFLGFLARILPGLGKKRTRKMPAARIQVPHASAAASPAPGATEEHVRAGSTTTRP